MKDSLPTLQQIAAVLKKAGKIMNSSGGICDKNKLRYYRSERMYLPCLKCYPEMKNKINCNKKCARCCLEP